MPESEKKLHFRCCLLSSELSVPIAEDKYGCLVRFGVMSMPFYALCPAPVRRNANESITRLRRRINLYSSVQISSVIQTDENENLPSSGKSLSRCQTPKPLLLVQPNTVGVIGGVSVFATLLFLEKLIWWSLRDEQESIPFVVCSDPALGKGVPPLTSFSTFSTNSLQHGYNDALIIENLKRKRMFLEQSGARCLLTPCHLSHGWLSDTSESCKLPFLHVGDCVARELKEAKLKPLEAGSSVRIGLLATDTATATDFYYERLQNQGFDVVFPDEATMKHIILPAVEALNKRDQEGARNLLRIAVHILLIRAVNLVILASDDLLHLLPPDDPILKKCIDPMDALARAAIKWSRYVLSWPLVCEEQLSVCFQCRGDEQCTSKAVLQPIQSGRSIQTSFGFIFHCLGMPKRR